MKFKTVISPPILIVQIKEHKNIVAMNYVLDYS